ncbi:polysaccharide deacetylase family protein [Geodermatophilus sp. SYSU D01036]
MTRGTGAGGPAPVPVLLYHAVTDAPGTHIAPFTVSPKAFRAQLDCLVAAGYRCTTFSQLLAERSSGAGPEGVGPADDGRTAVVTFDDGYADFADAALPALLERSFAGTVYVTTGWLEGGPPREPGPSDRMLAWSQLADLVDAGCEIGAHSHSHPQLDTLDRVSLRDELTRPKALLEDALGREVPSVAYPHGYHGPRVRRAARSSGYASAAAVRNRLSPPAEDHFRVSRLTVTASTTTEQLRAWLEPREPESLPSRESLPTTAWRAYRRGRAVLRGRPGSDYR